MTQRIQTFEPPHGKRRPTLFISYSRQDSQQPIPLFLRLGRWTAPEEPLAEFIPDDRDDARAVSRFNFPSYNRYNDVGLRLVSVMRPR